MLVFQLSLNIQYRLSALNRAGRGGVQNLRNGWMEIMKVIQYMAPLNLIQELW